MELAVWLLVVAILMAGCSISREISQLNMTIKVWYLNRR